MSFVTLLWSINATVAVMLAIICAVGWLADRRDLAYAMFCVTAVGTAICVPFELGMIYAETPADYGEWVRWYHLPIFLTLVGTLAFVRFYLGTGRLWLLWTIVAFRVLVLAVNFAVQPNFNFREIIALDHFPFLGEQVAVVGQAVPRPWQWLASASWLLTLAFLIDAAIKRWHKGGSESHRKALTVTLAIALPLVCSALANQLIVLGVFRAPVSSTPWFVGMLVVMSLELSREFLVGRGVRLQLAQLRGELAQLERVNMLGHLASGLAHELAQPLSATRLNVEVAERHLRGSAPDLEALREIVADIQKDNTRAVEVIDRLRTLVKRGTVEAQPLALKEVVQDVLALLRSEAVSRKVVLENHLPPDLPLVLGDRVHISHVLLNLVANAMDAVQGRPEERRNVVIEAHAAPNGGLETVVRDSGPGIPDDKLEAIFAPLFTTKSGGLGMGLALSRAIINAHGGRLWARNGDLGIGATFCFTLPLA
jgi:signal transduction histidine kinase